MKSTLIVDPEFERFVPPLSPKEYELLETSIQKEGCRDAIIVWDGVILDGYNRYKICQKHDIQFEIKNLILESRDEAISWICANQMGRRNITEETRRYLIGKRYEAEKRIGARNAAGLNQHTKPVTEVSPTMLGKARNAVEKYGLSGALGNEYQMSHTTVEKYGRYAQAVDRIATIAPRAIPHILSGTVQIGQDNMIDISKLSDRQIRAVTASIPYNAEHHLRRQDIIDALRNSQSDGPSRQPQSIPEFCPQTVKSMPAYDPDAEVASLTLTIPSWRTSVERVRSAANMEFVSRKAKESLLQALDTLRAAMDAITSAIQGGLSDD